MNWIVLRRTAALATVLLGVGASAGAFAQTEGDGDGVDLAIVDVAVIDGLGGRPARGRTILIDEGKIVSIADSGDQPDADRVIDGGGKYLIPGLIDSNVHATVYGNAKRRETVVRYGPRNEELALESAQLHLKHGVTTMRDSYGDLESLIAVRDRIERGEAVGSRMLVAGNIVGWGGPFSITFSLLPESELTYFQKKWNDRISQGVGEELADMSPDEVREAINAYLDKGPNFIKYGGSGHFRAPVLIGFSPRVQEVIVEETHKRGLIAETHATSLESLRLAVLAGIDFIQHPEILSADYTQELVDHIIERDVICGMRPNVLTGEMWRRHEQDRKAAIARQEDMPEPTTNAERRARAAARGDDLERHRRNAERLIEAGCAVTIATDNYQGDAPELRESPKSTLQEAGRGSLHAVEGLVELGLSPMEAIMAVTATGSRAAGMEDEIGTIEEGKIADLVLLGSDPLRDISNIRDIDLVIARGQAIDPDTLPEKRIFSTPYAETEAQ